MDILEKIVAHKREEIAHAKQSLPLEKLKENVESIIKRQVPSMSQALLMSDTGIIAEFKRKSPSKGWIKQNANIRVIPNGYQEAGAAAISILTDASFFGGSNVDLVIARKRNIAIPILYKNFIVDEYQIYQAREYGASAILLIAACLSQDECRHFIEVAHSLKMEVLMEIHSEEELEYSVLGADMCGINNRNLGTFETDVQNSVRLASMLPPGMVKVSESGIAKPETVLMLRGMGFRGFLIGENFMREPDPALALQQFIAQLKH